MLPGGVKGLILWNIMFWTEFKWFQHLRRDTPVFQRMTYSVTLSSKSLNPGFFHQHIGLCLCGLRAHGKLYVEQSRVIEKEAVGALWSLIVPSWLRGVCERRKCVYMYVSVYCVCTHKNQTLIGRSLALTLGCEGRCTCCFGSCLCLCCVEWPWWELTLIRQRGN